MVAGVPMQRTCKGPNSYTLNTAIGTTPEINYELMAGGEIRIPAASSITSLTWWSAAEAGGTYLPRMDSSGTAVTQTVAAEKAYPIPDALFGCKCLKCVVNASGAVEIVGKT